MTALDPKARERLVKVCGMLGSDHDGERASAAKQAQAILAEHSLTWNDVLAVSEPRLDAGFNPKAERRARYPDRAGPPKPAELLREHQRKAKLLLVSGFEWSEWERRFLNSIAAWRSPMSAKQEAQLRELEMVANAWRATRSAAA